MDQMSRINQTTTLEDEIWHRYFVEDTISQEHIEFIFKQTNNTDKGNKYHQLAFYICTYQLDNKVHNPRETYRNLILACQYGEHESLQWMEEELGEEWVTHMNDDFSRTLDDLMKHFHEPQCPGLTAVTAPANSTPFGVLENPESVSTLHSTQAAASSRP